MTEKRRMKGQFFLIAGLLLTVLFFIGLPKPESLAQTPTVEDLEYVFSNMEREFGRALTLGLNESGQVDKLQNFTRFSQRMLNARYITLESLWILSEGNTSVMINVSVGNFLASAANVTLNVTDDAGASVIQYLDVAANATNWTEFHSVTSEFNLTVSFNDDTENLEWERDKVNLYALINITRGENLKKEDISL